MRTHSLALTWAVCTLAFGASLSHAQAATAPRASAQTECDAANLTAAARQDGYAFHAAGGYCEGLIAEKHSVPSLQIVSFSVTTEAIGQAARLRLRTPVVVSADKQVLKARNMSGPAAYRFDARIRESKAIELDLGRIASKHGVDASSLAFVGEALVNGAVFLTPVEISRGERAAPWPARFLMSIRLSAGATSLAYEIVPLGGGPAVANGAVDGPIAGEQVVHLSISPPRPGSYKVNIVVRGTEAGDAGAPVTFVRRIFTGPDE